MRTRPALASLATLATLAASLSGQTVQPVQHGVVAPDLVVRPGPNVPQPPRVLLDSPPKHGMPAVPIGFGGNPQPVDQPVAIVDPLAEVGGTYTAFRNVVVKPGSASSSRISEPASVFADQNNGFFTANWYAAKSNNAGASWSYENPYTKFSAAFGGFCCDQRLVNQGGVTVWMLQYSADVAGNGGTRLAVSTSASNLGAGTFSHSYLMVPQSMGFAAGTWFDFPDCAASAEFFHFASNVFNASSQYQGAVVWKMRISDLAAGGTIGFTYINSTSIGGGSYRLTQNAGPRMYWASHDTTTSLRINWWDDAGGGVGGELKPMAAWTGGHVADPGPDGRDWTARADSRILGAYQNREEFGFLWHSGPIGGITKNFVRLARFSLADRSLIQERSIYNNTLSFMYPAAATNNAGHLAISCALGGGAFYPSTCTVIRDDLEEFASARIFASGNAGPTSNVWGDYYTVQRAPVYQEEMTWRATGMSLNGGGANGDQEPRMIHFGREAFEPNFTGLMVLSTPVNGIAIGMIPFDRFVEGNGSTPFYRSFTQAFANITVTAPSTHVVGPTTYLFHRWATNVAPNSVLSPQPVGQTVFTITNIGVQADTVEARYLPARSLTVQSTNPANGVAIQVSPNDFDGAGNGNTTFARRYREGELVSLTAPATIGFNPFKRWVVDGAPQPAGQAAIQVTMDASHTAAAQYWLNVAGTVSNAGAGCIGSNSQVPVHTVTWPAGQQGPQQGTPTTYTLARARGRTACALNLGFSTSRWGSFALPLNLNFIGITGCTLYHDIVSSESLGTDTLGTAQKVFTWPVSISAIGLPLYTSWAIIDPGTGRPLSVTYSNAMRSTAGGNQ